MIMTLAKRVAPTRRDAVKAMVAGGAAAAGMTSRASGVQPSATADKSPFVLVHAAWHGGWCWKKVAPFLRARGRDVHAPTLTGLGERFHLAHPLVGLQTHVEDVANVLEYEDLTGVTLVGHSNAGTLITAIAERLPERIGHLVYLDAFVPEDGQATIDLITFPRQAWEARVKTEGHGWLIPSLQPVPWRDFVRDVWKVTDPSDREWLATRLRSTPFKTFTDPVERKNPAAAALPRTYVRCRQHASARFDGYAEMARNTPGWRLRELPSAHEPFVTMPRELAEVLLEI
jgi:pimeloyl-ACP methyl ester carboxylesterase